MGMYPSQPRLMPPQGKGPRPTFALLGEAWKINFRNLGVFLPLGIIDSVAYSTFSGIEETLQKGVGLPLHIDQFTDAQWLTYQFASLVLEALFWMPFHAAVLSVTFRVFDGDRSPLEGLRDFVTFYARACQLGFLVMLIKVTLSFVLRLVAREESLWLGLPLSILVDVPFMLVVPAIVRYDLSLFDGFRYSFRRINESPFAYLGYLFAAWLMSCVGMLACLLGLVLTLEIDSIATALLLPPIAPIGPILQGNQASPYPRGSGQTI